LGVGQQAVAPLVVRLAVDDAVAGTTTRLGWLIGSLLGIEVLTFVTRSCGATWADAWRSTSSTIFAGRCSRRCNGWMGANRTSSARGRWCRARSAT